MHKKNQGPEGQGGVERDIEGVAMSSHYRAPQFDYTHLLSEVIQEPLPLKQKIPSAQPGVSLKPSSGQKTLEKQGEQHFSKTVFARERGNRALVIVL